MLNKSKERARFVTHSGVVCTGPQIIHAFGQHRGRSKAANVCKRSRTLDRAPICEYFKGGHWVSLPQHLESPWATLKGSVLI